MTAPTAPVPLGQDPAEARSRLTAPRIEVSDAVVARLQDACAGVSTDAATVAECSRDWWPLGIIWALEGQVAPGSRSRRPPAGAGCAGPRCRSTAAWYSTCAG
jgi:hypothetical protein